MLTVIVPVYNTEVYLSECIDSILNQSYTDIEVIIINDGSTDNSGLLCNMYQEKDKRVKVIHTDNHGVSNARNIGLSIANGEYITFVDSDDYISKDAYVKNIEILNNDLSIDFVQYPVNNRIISSSIIAQKELFDAWIFSNKRLTNYFCDKIFRRKYFNALRFPLNMRFEDRYLFSDILRITNKIYCSDYGNYHYRQHPSQITKQIDNRLKKDMINANLHTLQNIPKTCYNSYVRCYWDTLVLFQTIPVKLIDKGYEKEINDLMPDIKSIWLSKNPIGIKIRLSLKKLHFL